jgi:hypothetical protein
MKNLQTEIIINATPEKVWNILMDFAKYPEWNPFVKEITGSQQVGGQLNVTLNNGKGTSVFTPTVVSNETANVFEWLGSIPLGLFKGQHRFAIEKINDTQVKFIHSEQFSGLLAGIIMSQIGETTRNGFIAMNKALKERAEA